LATQTYTAQAGTWLYEAHGNPQWPARFAVSPRQRALEADYLRPLWHSSASYAYEKVENFSE